MALLVVFINGKHASYKLLDQVGSLAMSAHNLHDYAIKLCQSTSYDEAFVAYDEIVTELGYESLLYSYIPRISLDTQASQPYFSISPSYNNIYLDQYSQESFENIDYVIEAINQGNLAILDWWKDSRNGLLNSHQVRILNIMRNDYNIHNGLSIPTLTGARGIAAASISSSEPDRSFNLLKTETGKLLEAATRLFHSHVISNAFASTAFIKPLLSDLNKTEKKVLKCLLSGDKVPVIAEKLYKNKSYIENLVVSVRAKMSGVDVDGKPKISKDLLIHYCGLMGIYDQL